MQQKFSKQVLAIIMSVFLVVTLVPETAVANGYWNKNEGILLIDEDDYDPTTQILENVVHAKTGDELSSINDIAIEGIVGLTQNDLLFLADSTKLPNLEYLDLSRSRSESTIWGTYFAGSGHALFNLDLPKNITVISPQSFKDNNVLEYVGLPRTLTEIGEEAFSGCTSLESVDFEGLTNLDTIGPRAFSSSGLYEALLNDTKIAVISEETFLNCHQLVWVELPEMLDSIGERAFSNCPLLTELTLENSTGIVAFDTTAFQNSPDLEMLYVPQALVDVYNASAWTDPSQGGFAALQVLPLEGHWIWILDDDEDMVFTVSPTYALPGEIIEIEVKVLNEDIMFHSWFDFEEEIDFEDKYATKTTFVMPDDDVDIGANFLLTPIINGVPSTVSVGDTFGVKIVFPYEEYGNIDEDYSYDYEDEVYEGSEAIFLSLDDIESTAIVEKEGWVWDDRYLSLAVDPLKDAARVTAFKSGTTDLVWSWDVDGVVISASETITIQASDPALDPAPDPRDPEDSKKPGRLAQTGDESLIAMGVAFVVVAGAIAFLSRKRFAQ